MMTEQHTTDREPGYRVSRKMSGQYELNLWGKMPLGWIANLTAGMADTGLSIQRGAVQKVAGATWQADFEMKPLTADAAPEGIDYLRLASQGKGSMPLTSFSLEEFTLKEPLTRQDPLILEVRAKDQQGFLGALLGRLAFFSLFPEEMAIETIGGKIRDRIWLRSPGGQSPSSEVVSALHKSLSTRVCC